MSALQQVTKGGGGLTLASQWKSQFDDSEETDNEWKGENLQSPEHKGTNPPSLVPQVSIRSIILFRRSDANRIHLLTEISFRFYICGCNF